MTPRGSAEQLEARRRLAVTRVGQGWKQKDVAAFLGVSLKAVGKWVAAHRAGGDEALVGKPHPGAKPKLSKRQEQAVLAWLAKSPQAFGYKTDLWTTKRLAEVIGKRLGIRFHPNYLAAWLRRRNYTPQKPERGPAQGTQHPGGRPLGGRGLAPDPKKARDGRAHLVLIDESGFFLNPLVRRTWAPQGCTPKLIGFGRHRDKVSTIAAIVVSPQGQRISLDWHTDPKHSIDAAAVVGFLKKLLNQLHGRVIVVWDGGSNHKGPRMRELLSRYRRLHLERLPAYSPHLNPVEWIWSHLKYGLMANFVPRDVRHVDKVVQCHLLNLGKDPKLLRSLWSGSKLPLVNKNLAT